MFNTLALCHLVIAAGCTDGAAKLGAEEPVRITISTTMIRDTKRMVFLKRGTLRIKRKENKEAVLVYVDRLVCLSHYFQVNRIQA